MTVALRFCQHSRRRLFFFFIVVILNVVDGAVRLLLDPAVTSVLCDYIVCC